MPTTNPNDFGAPGAPFNLMVNGSSISIPAFQRVSALPSWMPSLDSSTKELTDEYKNTGKMYDTNPYDVASEQQQSRVLTTALNAGNNAAAEYANKARQAGGSGMGAGLIKAEASVGARATAGDMKLKQMEFDAKQRDAAATHASQIATTLAGLRDSYLKSLVDYSTKEDSTMADYISKMAAVDTQARATAPKSSGGYTVDRTGRVSEVYGNPFLNNGLPSNNAQLAPANGGGW